MIELGGGAGFLLEAQEAFGIRGKAGVNDLQGDVSPEPRVPRPVHLAHSARAQRGENFVRAESLPALIAIVSSPDSSAIEAPSL